LALQAFATGSVAAMDAKGGQRAHTPRFGIVTLYDGSAKYECAMPHWCASAKQLSGHIKNSEVAIISKNRSVDCPDVGYFWGEPGAVADVASLGYLARHRIGGSWAHLKNAVLLKVVVFSLVQYDMLLYLDMDVDAFPHTEQGWQIKKSNWQQSIEAFMASDALFSGSPDHSSPVNTGVFLVKPREWLFRAAVRCLRSCWWEPKLGFDSVGAPQNISNNVPLLRRLAAGFAPPDRQK